jgi:hypothetical protein
MIGRPAFRSAIYLLALGLTGCAPIHPAQAEVVEYRCSGDRLMSVTRNDGGATVRVGERSYELKPKPSPLGERYVTPRASLIIDGSFAAFVAEDLLDLEDCQATP